MHIENDHTALFAAYDALMNADNSPETIPLWVDFWKAAETYPLKSTKDNIDEAEIIEYMEYVWGSRHVDSIIFFSSIECIRNNHIVIYSNLLPVIMVAAISKIKRNAYSRIGEAKTALMKTDSKINFGKATMALYGVYENIRMENKTMKDNDEAHS